jgi:hypothetical protein
MADRDTPEMGLLIDGAYVRRVWRKLGPFEWSTRASRKASFISDE